MIEAGRRQPSSCSGVLCVALFVEHHLAANSLAREKELWERHGYRLFLEPAQPTDNGKGTTGGTGVMCMKGFMAGEFLPLELQQIFDEAAMQAGRFWQAITIRLRRCTLLLVALYLQPNLGPVGENMRRLAMLWKFLALTKLPWVVMGDWNCEHSDLLPTGWPAQTSGMVLVPSDVTGTCLAGSEDPGPFHPHLGLRLRMRSEPRAEQLRCILRPRRFPHTEKKPPQRSHTKLTQMQRREEQRRVHCQRDMAWQEAVTITAKQEALTVLHCPSWLARSGLPTLLGSVVDLLGQGYAFWASSVETF